MDSMTPCPQCGKPMEIVRMMGPGRRLVRCKACKIGGIEWGTVSLQGEKVPDKKESVRREQIRKGLIKKFKDIAPDNLLTRKTLEKLNREELVEFTILLIQYNKQAYEAICEKLHKCVVAPLIHKN